MHTHTNVYPYYNLTSDDLATPSPCYDFTLTILLPFLDLRQVLDLDNIGCKAKCSSSKFGYNISYL